MHRVIVQGSAAVFRDSERVVDPIVLRSLDGLVYADETFTDYIGGPSEEDRLAGALEPGDPPTSMSSRRASTGGRSPFWPGGNKSAASR